MQLIRYNSATATTVRQVGECTINLNASNGVASLTAKAVKALKIKSGDKIELVQDASRPTDWYLAKSELGFNLRMHTSKGKESSFQFSCRGAITDLLESLGMEPTATIRVNIDPEPIEVQGMQLHALATKGAVQKKKVGEK